MVFRGCLFSRLCYNCCMISVRWNIYVAVSCLCLASVARADWPFSLTEDPVVSIGTLDVVWKDWVADDPDARPGQKTGSVLGACRGLGGALLAGKGLWGSGLFSDVRCFAKRADSTIELLGDHAKNTRIKASWVLHVDEADDRIEFTLSYQPCKGIANQKCTPVTASAISMERSPWLRELLETDADFNMAVAASILDGSPALMLPCAARTPVPSSKKGAPGKGESLPDVQFPETSGDRFVAYKLLFDPAQGVWRAAVKGTFDQPGAAATSSMCEVDSEMVMVAHFAQGRGSQMNELLRLAGARQLEAVRKKVPGYSPSLGESLATAVQFAKISDMGLGFLGLRYGREMAAGPTGAGGLPKANLYGAVLELRGGPLEGLRSYVDVVPRVQRRYANGSVYMGWRRILASYGFAYKTMRLQEKIGLRSIEIAPKIGSWNFESQYPVVSPRGSDGRPGNVELRKFQFRNALSLGGELSVDFAYLGYGGRFWHARDFSVNILGNANNGGVVSSRYGIDLTVAGPRIPSLGERAKVVFMGFVFNDQVTLRGQYESVKIGLETGYGGGGASFVF